MATQADVGELRAGERRRVRVRALIREAGSQRIDIDLVDLSVGGFRFESVHRFATGARVFLSIPSLAPLEATIAWKHADYYGCRFLRPLHLAIFEALAARLGG
jgi:PilZ domain